METHCAGKVFIVEDSPLVRSRLVEDWDGSAERLRQLAQARMAELGGAVQA